jgi:predicted  nucleic acid-binding Zn-ribbon protein
MGKMEQAHSLEFYLEASWIAYSILEDRLLSALLQTGGSTYSDGKDIRMLGQKIVELEQRKTNDQLLSAYFNDDLIDELKKLKKSRNDLMHELADSTKTILELDKETYLLSENSKSLVNSTCNASRLLKKNREKA